MRIFKYFFLCIILISCKNENDIISNEMVIRLSNDPAKLHPVISPNALAREVFQYIFLPLADYHPDSLVMAPILIDKIPDKKIGSEGISFDFSIRSSAKWPDGKPITANDYLFTIKSVIHPLTQATAYRSHISKISDIQIDADNNKKFTVYFENDFPLAFETASNMAIYPAHIYDPLNTLSKYSLDFLADSNNQDSIKIDTTLNNFAQNFNSTKYFRENVVGSGPYSLKSWNTNQSIVLEGVEDYWGQDYNIPQLNQTVDRLVFQIVPDANTAFTQLLNGNLDVMAGLTSQQMSQLESEKNNHQIEVLTPQLTKYYFLLLNHKNEILANKNIRRALSHLLDVDLLISSLENGQAKKVVAPFHYRKPYYNDEIVPLTKSKKSAKTLLSDDGWKDTDADGTLDKIIDGNHRELELRIHIPGSPLSERIALMLKESCDEIGISLDIIQKPFRQILKENIYTDDFDIVPGVASQSLSYDDPYTKWHSSRIDKKGGNDANYSSPEIDKLCEQIRNTQNIEEQIPYFKEIQKIIYEDQAVIFLYSPIERIALNKRFIGNGTSKRPGYLANTFSLRD